MNMRLFTCFMLCLPYCFFPTNTAINKVNTIWINQVNSSYLDLLIYDEIKFTYLLKMTLI